MVDKAIDILKTRWREVLLIVVLQVGLMLLTEEIKKIAEAAELDQTRLPGWGLFVLGLGWMGVCIVFFLLYLGFLKTSALEGKLMRQPEQLMGYGRPYFWRYLFFSIQIDCVKFLLAGAMVGLLAATLWKGQDLQSIPAWIEQVCLLVVILVVIKPMLFIPARMLVYNNSPVEAFFYVGRYEMGRIGQLNQSIGVGFAAILLAGLIYTLVPEGTVVYYVFLGLHHVLASVVLLYLTLMVVLWMQEEFNAKQRALEEENE